MKRYEYQVCFFLNKEENKAFTEYCISKNVALYIAGRSIVKDFMMSTEDAIEQTIISSSLEDEFEVMKNDVEMLVTALGVQVEKCEKLTEEISNLQDESTRRGHDSRFRFLWDAIDRLWDEHYELASKVD